MPHLFTIVVLVLLTSFTSAWSAPRESEIHLFDPRGLPLYSVPESDNSYTKGILPSSSQEPFMGFQLEVNGEPVSPGTLLILENGESFIFREVMGYGHHTIVLRDFKDRIIRLAQHIDVRTLEMQFYYLEAAILLASVVDARHIIKLSDFQFKSKYVTVVELLSIEQTLDNFLNSQFEVEDQRYQDLLRFFEAFHRVESLGSEFMPQQIGYVSGRGWVLFDLGPGVKILKTGETSNRVADLIINWSMNTGMIGVDLEQIDQLETELNRRFNLRKKANSHPAETAFPLCRKIFSWFWSLNKSLTRHYRIYNFSKNLI